MILELTDAILEDAIENLDRALVEVLFEILSVDHQWHQGD